jgi:hypothetical protein
MTLELGVLEVLSAAQPTNKTAATRDKSDLDNKDFIGFV